MQTRALFTGEGAGGHKYPGTWVEIKLGGQHVPGILELDESVARLDQDIPQVAVVAEESLQILLPAVFGDVP